MAVVAAFVTVALLVPVSVARPARAAAAPSGFQEQVVFSGLDHPTNVEFAVDGRVFVAEKSGIIKVFDSLADSTATVYADLRAQVHNYWDRGLLGLALHPDFPADPRIYVLYTYDGLIGGPSPKWGTATSIGDPCPTPPGPTSDGCQVSGVSVCGTERDVHPGAEPSRLGVARINCGMVKPLNFGILGRWLWRIRSPCRCLAGRC